MNEGIPENIVTAELNKLEKTLSGNQKMFMEHSHQIGVDVGFLQGMAFVQKEISNWNPRPGCGVVVSLLDLQLHVNKLIVERCKE